MFIQECLTTVENLATVRPNDTITYALQIMKDKNLNSLPVVDQDGSFYGTVSKSSIFELLEDGKFVGDFAAFVNLPLAEGVDHQIPRLTIDHLYEDLLPVIVRYPFVPIVDESEQFLGIIKRKDIELILESVFGIGVKGTRMVITHYEGKGVMKEIVTILGKHDTNVISCVSFDSEHHGVRRILMKFTSTDSADQIKADLEKHGYVVTSVRENYE
ncbi:CBS domain-containing protein [Brevibacillus sp. SYSU BS000544]|uniref:CBS domain-containing protein n=1 Tax=Brevibacillus sp. SYSU BS000544 TaxID=3416443 RepID=UPI003CE55A4B